MSNIDDEFGRPSPQVRELERFAFLRGRWRCDATVRSAGGSEERFVARWVGRFILDGMAMADEYRMTDLSGSKVIVLGTNIRTYDVARKAWSVKWLNALTGEWTDLVRQDMGGITFHGQSLSYVFEEPTAGHGFTRATYTIVSDRHFIWLGDKSEDRRFWSEFMRVDAYRE
jgi:hypothetical protein